MKRILVAIALQISALGAALKASAQTPSVLERLPSIKGVQINPTLLMALSSQKFNETVAVPCHRMTDSQILRSLRADSVC